VSGTRYDLVFFTALWEERYFLVRYLLGNVDLCSGAEPRHLPRDPLFPDDDALGMMERDGLRIGVVTTEAMGGVRSAVKITQICEQLLPRRIVVVGLCGAYRPEKNPPLQLGSVCVADGHEYHSFGKISGPSKIFQMRELPALTADERATALKQWFPSHGWVRTALEWQGKSVRNDWLKWTGKANEQRRVEGNP